MEQPTPRTLLEYCARFSVDLGSAKLPCLFCNNLCSAEDLQQFIEKNLRLVWKSNRECFACCEKCLWASAKYEYENHFQCIVRTDSVEAISGKSLDVLVVRCVNCLTELSLEEKYAAYLYDLEYILVRGGWRSFCKTCVHKVLI